MFPSVTIDNYSSYNTVENQEKKSSEIPVDLVDQSVNQNNSNSEILLSKKVKIINTDDFKPVFYSGYIQDLYCSYEEIITAIESWGKVEAILVNSKGLNHAFIVKFNQPLRFSSYGEGVMVNLTGGHGIVHTPFYLRRMKGHDYSNIILSENMMVFDIHYLRYGRFDVDALLLSQRLLQDEMFEQIREVAVYNDDIEIINSAYSERKRAKKLLAWIKQSGLSMLEKGIYRLGNNPAGECPVETIIDNYVNSGSFSPWKVVKQASQ